MSEREFRLRKMLKRFLRRKPNRNLSVSTASVDIYPIQYDFSIRGYVLKTRGRPAVVMAIGLDKFHIEFRIENFRNRISELIGETFPDLQLQECETAIEKRFVL